MFLNLSPLATHLNESLCSLRFATKVCLLTRIISCSHVLKSVICSGQQHLDRYCEEADFKACIVVILLSLSKHCLIYSPHTTHLASSCFCQSDLDLPLAYCSVCLRSNCIQADYPTRTTRSGVDVVQCAKQ